jgi:hypothetical protein
MMMVAFLPLAALADHQNNSFTYTSTAGMFEDMYDYFTYSPAYLPGFQKNAFWGQLSNLQNQGDKLVNNSSNSNYVLGGQVDMMGMGRIGAMFDWTSYTTAQATGLYNGVAAGTGFQDATLVSYLDLNGDGQIDARSESYSRQKRYANFSNSSLYLPYGLGKAYGEIDLGAAFSWKQNSFAPTYNPSIANSSFDEIATVRNYNLLTGQEIGPHFDRNRTGSLTYGNSQWILELAGRTQILPDLDLVVNVAPVLNVTYNDYKYDTSDVTNYSPSNPGIISQTSVTQHDSGLASAPVYADYAPGSGLGFLANARADYTYAPNILLTGIVGFQTSPQTLDSGKNKYETVTDTTTRNTVGGLVLANDTNSDTTINTTGTSSYIDLNAKVRAQFIAKGWKLGLGANFDYNDNSWDFINKNHTTSFVANTGTGDPLTDITTTTTSGSESESKSDTATNTIELPIGVILNVLDNLPLRFGAVHTIKIISASTSTLVTHRDPMVVTTTNGNGAITGQTVTGMTNSPDEYSNAPLTVAQSNTFYYGLSWWPFPQVQIDLAGFTNVLDLTGYKASFNFYF